jgi:ATP-dependent RNA helicase DDX5/DBP2
LYYWPVTKHSSTVNPEKGGVAHADEVNMTFESLGFTEPTPIQALAWPVVLRGRDLIAIAETGSGKTYAYALPAIMHAATSHLPGDADGNRAGEGSPSALILAPTRELAMQIDMAVFPFCSALGLRHLCVYGGAPKASQVRALRGGVHVLTATPGRLLDLLTAKACLLASVTLLVLDEADRMLSMGFEAQVRDIVAKVRSGH